MTYKGEILIFCNKFLFFFKFFVFNKNVVYLWKDISLTSEALMIYFILFVFFSPVVLAVYWAFFITEI